MLSYMSVPIVERESNTTGGRNERDNSDSSLCNSDSDRDVCRMKNLYCTNCKSTQKHKIIENDSFKIKLHCQKCKHIRTIAKTG